ncbi:sex peptide receptor-like [Watersipora subatra]|uniref:sex peptide receptor-like n=1 Tax=Watersipora subatra TaxID=2589382 RepID=UPI00355C2D75
MAAFTTLAEYATENETMDNNGAELWLSEDEQVSGNLSNFLPLFIQPRNGGYSQILMGYLLPGVIILTTFLNVCVFCILIKPSMRSSVNVILAALAISDTMTGLTALPYYMYFYSIGNRADYVPYHWCYVQKLCSGILPTIFHTVSVWLTLTLAVQRYMYLCHSLRAKTLCTVKRMVRASISVFIISFFFHSPRLFDSSFVMVSIYSDDDGDRMETCVEVLQDWAEYTKTVYFPVYYWIRLVTVHLIPTIGLIILTIILIAVIKTSSRRRRRLILQNRNSEWRKVREANCTTLLLVVVVSVFIIVEVPIGSLMLLTVTKNQNENKGINLNQEQQEMLTTIFNFVVLISYPTNFFIYVGMSKQFRSHLIRQVSIKKYTRVDTERTQQTATSREKSNSIELLKSIFTVTAVPLVKHTRRHSATPSNISSRSTTSSTKAPSVVTVKLAEDVTTSSSSTFSLLAQTRCTCKCPICVTECSEAMKTFGAYANEAM